MTGWWRCLMCRALCAPHRDRCPYCEHGTRRSSVGPGDEPHNKRERAVNPTRRPVERCNEAPS